MPSSYRSQKTIPRGVANRRAALAWIKSNNIKEGMCELTYLQRILIVSQKIDCLFKIPFVMSFLRALFNVIFILFPHPHRSSLFR